MLKLALKVMIDFTSTMFLFPVHWRLWLALLFSANFIAPLFFLGSLEGWVVLATGMIAAVLEMIIFARLGFVRLVGLGHIVWFGLVPWLWMRLDDNAPAALRYWAFAVIVLNSLSLVIDVVDVARYLLGEREPHLVLIGE